MAVLAAFVAALLALRLSADPHPFSLSHTTLVVRGASAELAIRFHVQSLLESLPLDRDGDRTLTAQELGEERAEIERYFAGTYTLRIPAGDAIPASQDLEASLARLELEDPSRLDPGDLPWARAELSFTSGAPIERLLISSRVFLEQNPLHRDFLTLAYEDEEPVSVLFHGESRTFLFERARIRRPNVFRAFVGEGLTHILTGYDHLAFLLALFVASRGLRSLLVVVTAFTLAHSITLALAALGQVDAGWSVLGIEVFGGRFVELSIALSIAYVGVDNLLRKELHTPWLEAFGFGLVHGLGFAGFLGEALEAEPLKITALVGFNLGVELGQVAAVGAATVVLWLLVRRQPEASTPERGLAPPWFRRAASLAVAAVGLYWFIERAGWIA